MPSKTGLKKASVPKSAPRPKVKVSVHAVIGTDLHRLGMDVEALAKSGFKATHIVEGQFEGDAGWLVVAEG